jgi:signal transduction histidine kinase
MLWKPMAMDRTGVPSAAFDLRLQRRRQGGLLSTVLVICLITFAASWYAIRAGEERLLRDEATASATRWAVYLRDNFTSLERTLEKGILTPEDIYLLKTVTRAGDVLRFKLIGPDGRVVRASRKEDVGKAAEENFFATLVMNGQTIVKIEWQGGGSDTVVSQAFVPIMRGKAFRGAVEVHVDMTGRALSIRELGNRVLFWIVAMLSIFMSVCGFFVWRNIRVREAELTMVKASRKRALEAEIELDRARRDAEEESRIKSEFLATMSHELRTPLNAILGFSEIIKTETFGPVGSTRYRDYATDINDSGAHLLAVINDILDLSKVEAGKAELHEEWFDVPDLIRSALGMVTARAEGRSIALDTRLADGLPPLFADSRKVKQILVNLLSNAVKFTDPGGTVTVAAELTADGAIRLRVIDDGIGMEEADIPKALSAFGQVGQDLDRAEEGTGLGLPLTKALTELHDGVLALESARGVGTTVTVTFPVARSGTRATETTATAG